MSLHHPGALQGTILPLAVLMREGVVAIVKAESGVEAVSVRAAAVAASQTTGHQVTVTRAEKEEGIENGVVCIELLLQLFRSESHSGSDSSMEEEYGVRKETLLHGVSLLFCTCSTELLATT